MLLRTSSASSVASVMMPNPPAWMSPRMTAWPKGVQNVAVSTVISPVTQTAETDVNSAGIRTSEPGSIRETGSISSPAPTMMTARNAKGRDRTGWERARRTKFSFPAASSFKALAFTALSFRALPLCDWPHVVLIRRGFPA